MRHSVIPRAESLRSTFAGGLAINCAGSTGHSKPQWKEVMNWKKFFFAFIAAFIFLFAFGFLWYATLMHDAHREVPTLLRPEADFKS
jgi:hypothetical protein